MIARINFNYNKGKPRKKTERNSENINFGQYGVVSASGHKSGCKCSFCRINKGDQQNIRRFLNGRPETRKRLMSGSTSRIGWKTIDGKRIMIGGNNLPDKKIKKSHSRLNDDYLDLTNPDRYFIKNNT